MTDSFENVRTLFGGYFHQDWPSEAASPDDAVSNYLRSEPMAAIEGALGEIEQLLAGERDEAEISRTLRSLGSEYEFAHDGYTASEWLRHLHDRLANWIDEGVGS